MSPTTSNHDHAFRKDEESLALVLPDIHGRDYWKLYGDHFCCLNCRRPFLITKSGLITECEP